MTSADILIIEPELIIAEDIKRRLESEGYSVTSMVGNGQEAERASEMHHTDLVLMELMIPDRMTGIDVAMEIMEDHGIPVIVLSTECHDGTNGGSLNKGRGAGPDNGDMIRDGKGYNGLPADQPCVAKPLNMNELKVVIEKAVRVS